MTVILNSFALFVQPHTQIDQHQEVMTISSNGFWHLSLAQNLFVGGVNHVDRLPLDLKYKSFFVGCIQRVSFRD